MSLKQVRESSLIEHLKTIGTPARVALIYDKPNEVKALRNSLGTSAHTTQGASVDALGGGTRRITLSLNQARGQITIEAYDRYELAAADEALFVEALSGYDHIILSNPDRGPSTMAEALRESLSSLFGPVGARMLLGKIRDPQVINSAFNAELFRRKMETFVGAGAEQLKLAFLRGLHSRLRSNHGMKENDT